MRWQLEAMLDRPSDRPARSAARPPVLWDMASVWQKGNHKSNLFSGWLKIKYIYFAAEELSAQPPPPRRRRRRRRLRWWFSWSTTAAGHREREQQQ